MTTITDHALDTGGAPFGVRVYTPETPVGPGLVWAHGGAFAAGEIDMPEADAVASALAHSGIAVVSVDYSLAPVPPEWAAANGLAPRGGVHFPVAADQLSYAYDWATGAGIADGPWAIGGASAGANLTAGAILRRMDAGLPLPALAILAYPTLHAVQPAHSAELSALLAAHPEFDGFPPAAIFGMYANYLGSTEPAMPLAAVPGTATATQLVGFPATLMITAQFDPLRTSGEAFAATLTDAGTPVELVCEPGVGHGHLNLPDEPAFRASLDRMTQRLLMLGR